MKIIRVGKVAEKIGGSIALVWRKSKDEADFPKPIRLSGNVTGWVEAEIDAYLERKIAEYRENPVKRATAAKAATASAAKRMESRAALSGAEHAPA